MVSRLSDRASTAARVPMYPSSRMENKCSETSGNDQPLSWGEKDSGTFYHSCQKFRAQVRDVHSVHAGELRPIITDEIEDP